MIYVLVSGSFETYDTPHKADTLGQQVEMPDDLARSAILSGAALLPKETFDGCGFNAEELAQYPNARVQSAAPAAFQAKLAKAVKAASDYRAQLAAPPATKQAKPEVTK